MDEKLKNALEAYTDENKDTNILVVEINGANAEQFCHGNTIQIAHGFNELEALDETNPVKDVMEAKEILSRTKDIFEQLRDDEPSEEDKSVKESNGKKEKDEKLFS